MTETTPDIETLYRAASGSQTTSAAARNTAQAVVDRMLEVKQDARTSDLTRRIQHAASEGNSDLIFKLADELKSVKNGERERQARLVQLADEFSFAELLEAFPTDYRELACEIGLLVVQKMSEGAKRSRPRPPAPHYVIENEDGHTLEVVKGKGKPKLPGAEKEFYKFMGFDVSEDGRTVSPTTFGNLAGEVVPTTKKALLDDLIAGNEFWTKEGYSIKLKERVDE